MGMDEGQQATGGLSRRSVLRGGLLAGAGLATIGTASAVLTGTAKASIANPQPQWSYCVYCQNMYHGLFTGQCAANPEGGNIHEFAAGFFNYEIYYGSEYSNTSNPQGNWNWCSSCACLFHVGGDNGGCFGQWSGYLQSYQSHLTGAVNYQLNWGGPGASNLQTGWLYCSYCQVLYYPQGGSNGFCIINPSGVHDGSGSFKYDIYHSGTE